MILHHISYMLSIIVSDPLEEDITNEEKVLITEVELFIPLAFELAINNE